MKRIYSYGFVGLLGFLCSCASILQKPVAQGPCEKIEKFLYEELAKYQEEIDETSREYQEEQWKIETASPEASPERLSQYFGEYQAAIYDAKVLKSASELESVADPLLSELCPHKDKFRRAYQMLKSTILVDFKTIQKERENQDLQDALIQKNNEFRLSLPDESQPVSKAFYLKKLAANPNAKDRKANYLKANSSRAKQWLQWGFKELVEGRNKEAVSLGYKNYYEYRFWRNQLDLQNYRTLVGELKLKLAPKLRRALMDMSRRYGIAKPGEWDIAYLREKAHSADINEYLMGLHEDGVISIAKEFYAQLDFDVAQYGFVEDLYPRAGKNSHAFALALVFPRVDLQGALLPKPKSDIRFLANLKSPVKLEDISTVIHELGHAIHAAEVRQPLPYFRGIGSVETEAIAMLVAHLSETPEFIESYLTRVSQTPPKTLKRAIEKNTKASRLERAFVLMRQVFFSDFEYQMYSNPQADFGALWEKLHKEYWGIESKSTEAGWDIDHYLMAPVYVQNYAIGILMVEQMVESLNKEFPGRTLSKEVGDKIRGILLKPGQEFDYLDLVKQFTGKPLSVSAGLL